MVARDREGSAQPFKARGLMSIDVTYAYRDKCSCRRQPRRADLVREFLGRSYDFAAYEKYLRETAA